MTDVPCTDREVQEALFAALIYIRPEDSAHGEHWHRGDCDCGWSTTGSDGVVEEAAYEHIAEVHLLGLDRVWALGTTKTSDRAAAADPHVWVAPGRLGGKPCIGGHRLSVEQITRLVWPDGVDAAQSFFPYLTRPQVLVACWYQAIHGKYPWTVRWSAWAHTYGDAMWSGRWNDVPDPNTPNADAAGIGKTK